MRRFPIVVALAAFTLAIPAYAADVGVSVSIGEPGFYGRIDIGGYPHPEVIYAQPVVVGTVPVGRPPIYLRVPPGYEKHWRRHCHEYNACNERVYFVRDKWYTHEYAPRYRERHRHIHEERREHRRDHYRDDHGDRHDRRDHGDHGNHGRD
jgi:hypothetical protein